MQVPKFFFIFRSLKVKSFGIIRLGTEVSPIQNNPMGLVLEIPIAQGTASLKPF